MKSTPKPSSGLARETIAWLLHMYNILSPTTNCIVSCWVRTRLCSYVFANSYVYIWWSHFRLVVSVCGTNFLMIHVSLWTSPSSRGLWRITVLVIDPVNFNELLNIAFHVTPLKLLYKYLIISISYFLPPVYPESCPTDEWWRPSSLAAQWIRDEPRSLLWKTGSDRTRIAGGQQTELEGKEDDQERKRSQREHSFR